MAHFLGVRKSVAQAVKGLMDSELAGPCQRSSVPRDSTSMEDCVHQEEGERNHRYAGSGGGSLPWLGGIQSDSTTIPWWPASGASLLFSGPAKLRYIRCINLSLKCIIWHHWRVLML